MYKRNGFKKILSSIISIALMMSLVQTNNVLAAPESQGEVMKGAVIEEIQDFEPPVGGWTPPEIRIITKELEEVETAGEGSESYEDLDEVFVKGASTVGYDALTLDGQRKFYHELETAAVKFMNSNEDLITTKMSTSTGDVELYVVSKIEYKSKGLTKNEAITALNAFDYDHPAYYWLGADNKLWSSDTDIYLNTIQIYASVSARAAINEQIIDGVKEYVDTAEKAEDTLDKIAVIHDLIVNDVDYAYESDGTTPESAKWAHSVHGVFDQKYKKVVCEGYADVFSLIMNYMDIPNYYIVGTAGSGGAGGGGGHAWNAVYDEDIDKYIYMDLTWDDIGSKYPQFYYYKYFGMPMSDFEKTHFKNLPSSEGKDWLYELKGTFADSFEKTYYYQGGYYCNTTDYSEFAKKINTKCQRFKKILNFIIDADDGGVEAAGEIFKEFVNGNGENTDYKQFVASYKGRDFLIVAKNMINDVDLSSSTINLSGDTFAYTGSEVKPEVESVVCNGIKLIDDNYTVSYEDNIEEGKNTAKVIISGDNRFKGSASKTFTISKEALSSEMVTLSAASFEYDGSSKKPDVIVKKGGQTLTNGSDYELEFSDDTVNAGTVTLKVIGKGEYIGTVVKNYTITPASLKDYEVTLKDDAELTYDGNQKRPEVVSVKKDSSSQNVDEKYYDTSYSDNVDAGTATVTVSGKDNYKDSATKTFTIAPADISQAKMVLSKTKYELTDIGPYEPEADITYNGISLVKGVDYDLSYSNNDSSGTASATAVGKGNYTGKITEKFTIVAKEQAKVIEAPEGYNLLYTGEAQSLNSKGRASGGTMVYRLEGGSWSEEVAYAEDVGKYKVYYKVRGDAEHSDSEEFYVLATISEVSTRDKVYNEPDTIEAVENDDGTTEITLRDKEGEPVTGATLSLRQGGEVVQSVTSDESGKMTLEHIDSDYYNLIYEKNGITNVLLVYLEDGKSLEDIELPSNMESSSKLELSNEYANVLVGGLELVAGSCEAGSSIEMQVKPSEHIGKNNELLKSLDNSYTAKGRNTDFVDFSIIKTFGEDLSYITGTSDVVQIIIPFDSKEKKNFKVARYHEEDEGAEVTSFDPLLINPKSFEDATFFEDDERGRLFIYGDCFSVYAINYETSSGSEDSENNNDDANTPQADDGFAVMKLSGGFEITYPTTVSYIGINQKKRILKMLKVTEDGKTKHIKKISIKNAKNVGNALITKIILEDGDKLKKLSIPIKIVRYNVRTEDIVSMVTGKKIKVAIPEGKKVKVSQKYVKIDEANKLITFDSKYLTGTCSYR
ncbi:Transglutaminase-like superfamily protein [Lachnospiraceae bacterium KH1T2]|nr:Transglutaminase-like superfamily protein [Lachnospiraceae bacterium KH1T2]